ncbi:hypothetical protein BV25DRAFT_749649 [Artomyces pyxidatus]|uniref:Uncharacterized protein n=1 Tax=Artomyces pyxidatus TaxID=48021 RepID=A0ACB8T0Z6_9AGAM|nr:hypothetical protein BV25DRAFT_749649 [Artomyces pyxidatus]
MQETRSQRSFARWAGDESDETPVQGKANEDDERVQNDVPNGCVYMQYQEQQSQETALSIQRPLRFALQKFTPSARSPCGMAYIGWRSSRWSIGRRKGEVIGSCGLARALLNSNESLFLRGEGDCTDLGQRDFGFGIPFWRLPTSPPRGNFLWNGGRWLCV